MQNNRSVALKLHSLHDDDQRWLLSQLPEDDRREIEVLLAELTELGIPRLPLHELEEEVTAGLQPDSSEPETAHLPDASRVVDQAEVSQILSLAESEPAEVMGILLSLSQWRWQEGFLDQLGEPYRQTLTVVQASSNGQMSGRLRQLMLEHFASRISQMPVMELRANNDQELVAAGVPSRWNSIFSFFRSSKWQR